jgi:hypothetical protein
LESDRFSGAIDVQMRRGWSGGPRFRFEQTTDAALAFTSHIWAAGAGAGCGGERWSMHADAESGRREDAAGGADVWGASGRGALRLASGVRLEASAMRRERQRNDADALRVDGRFVSTAGNLSSRRFEARLGMQARKRWSASLRVARLDKEYDDVNTRVRTWRYGFDAGCAAARWVRVDAGWHLDDAAGRAAEGYALRTRALFAGFALEPTARLHLRGRVDLLDMQRDLENRKAVVSGGLDLELRPALLLGAEYENDLYEDELGSTESYRAHVVSISLRRGFRW